MTGYQRAMWLTSVLLILFAIASFVMAIVDLVIGSGSLGAVDISPYGMGGLFLFAAILGVAQAIYQFVVGCIGVRASSEESKAGVMYVLAIINFICACVTFAFFAFNEGSGNTVSMVYNVWITLINAVVSAILMYSAGRAHAGATHPMVY